MPRLTFCIVVPLALPLLLLEGCSQETAADPSPDAATSADARTDTAAPDTGSLDTNSADSGSPDVTAPADTPSSGEKTYTLTTGQCFTFATTAIEESTVSDSGVITRCGDFTLEGASYPFLVGIDGTMCNFEGTYPTLESVPKSAEFCGRIINLGNDKNRAFLKKVDPTHHYRVHVLESFPKLIFSFALVD